MPDETRDHDPGFPGEERRQGPPRFNDMLRIVEQAALDRARIMHLEEEVRGIKDWRAETTARLEDLGAHLTAQDEAQERTGAAIAAVQATLLSLGAQQAPINARVLRDIVADEGAEVRHQETLAAVRDLKRILLAGAGLADSAIFIFSIEQLLTDPHHPAAALWGFAGCLLTSPLLLVGFFRWWQPPKKART